ncbi:BatD family protein [Rubripirellula sp.]|nr:BatD family protein [Rubripirellula sp.]MDB4749521.1 BatD family protein [Rubripirellula sp.]
MMRKLMTAWAFPCLALLFCSTPNVEAADVQSSVSTRETYVNLPFTLQIQINNAHRHDNPMIPTVDGLEIVPQGPPSRSYRTTIINGHTTQRNTLTYLYSVTATREGTFTIPAVTVIVDGKEIQTSAVRVVATQSETDDLMFVEIEGKDDEIYVGQSLQLTLRIWVRAYRDQNFNVTLNEATMWSLISKQTQWGNFQETLQQLAKNRQIPVGKLTLREDSEGQEREYLLYEIDGTVYPDRPGEIDGNDVRIILNYPEELGRARNPLAAFGDDFFRGAGGLGDGMFSGFGSQIAITSVRPIIAETEVEPITVKPIPEKGRPLNYRGAVGQYQILSEARPRTVKVGDPITLNIGIQGEGPMELLRAPPLPEQEDLTREFKVPNQPLAGFVNGKQKVFSTTIRPLTEGTTEIPGIEYSYFDPKEETFVSIKSDPITIEVKEAELLALDAIVGNQSGAPLTSPPNTPSEQRPEAAALAFPPNLLSSAPRRNAMPLGMIVLLLFPPACVAAIAIFLNRHYLNSFVSAKHRFRKAMASATTPQDVVFGLEQFLQNRYRLDAGRTLQNQTVGALRASSRGEVAIEVERLYHDCERNPDESNTEQFRKNAESIVEKIYEPNVRRSPLAQSGYLRPNSALILLALLLSPVAFSTSQATETAVTQATVEDTNSWNTNTGVQSSPAKEVARFSDAQIKELLDEASSMYAKGMQIDEQSESSLIFAKAAERLQLLVETGIVNERLFASLAYAQTRSGNTAKAVANYRRALRYAPENQKYRDRLAVAEGAFDSTASQTSSQLQRFRTYNNFLLHFVTPNVMLSLSLLAWFSVWGLLAWRLIYGSLHWKLPTACLVLLAVSSFSSYQLRVSEFTVDDVAVVTQPEISLREGDGSEFAIVGDTPFVGGDVVQVLDQRGLWHKVKLSDGQSGWLPSSALQLI